MKIKSLYIVFCMLFFVSSVHAQLCMGSLGDAVVNIDFGSGTGRGAALGSAITAYTYSSGSNLDEGVYTIANTTSGLKSNAWHVTTDHTGNTNGYMMVINSATLASEGVFYTKSVTGLCAGTTYEFSAWIMNIMNPSAGTDQYNPNVTFRVTDSSGAVLNSYNTGSISQSTSGVWKQFGFYFTLGAYTDVVISILNSAPSSHPGNDIALDDITFKACGPIVTASIQNNSSTNLTTCENGTATYTLQGSVGTAVYSDPAYQWQISTDNGVTWTDVAGATATTYDALLPTAGTYMYRMATAQLANISTTSCRVSSNAVTITVSSSPLSPTITTVQPSCLLPTGTITIEEQVNCTYSVDGTNYQTSAVFSGLAGGDYSVSIKGTNGCISNVIPVHIDTIVANSGTATVNVIQPVICLNPYGTITFTNSDYEYSFDDGLTWTTNNTMTGVDIGTYVVKSRNSYACETPAITIEIEVPPGYPPTPTAQITQPDCFTATGTIEISDSAPFYSFDNGLNWTTSNIATGLIPGQYQLLIKNALGCNSYVANTSEIIGFVNTEPLPVASTPQQFCVQQNATLNDVAISGSIIRWYDAATNGNVLAGTTSLQNGTYYASQSVTPCESLRIPVEVVIQNTPAPTGTALQDFCTTQNPTIASFSITGTSVVWYDQLTNGTVMTPTTPLENGVTYYATQTINGCESVNRLAITAAIVTPSIPVNDVAEFICDDLSDGIEIIDLTDYNAKITNCTSCIFSYYPSRTAAENQDVTAQITDSSNYNLPLGNTLFYVRIDSNDKCYQVVPLSLTLVSNPIIPISDSIALCQNTSITVDAGSGFDSYLWSTAETTQQIALTSSGAYSVTVTQNHGNVICSTTKNFTVFPSNIATIATIETQDWTDANNIIVVELTDSSIGDYEYSLDGITYQDSNIFTGLYSGDYMVHVRDKNNCGEIKQEVFLLNYPKYFTPNADGYNDTWAVKFSASEPTINTRIFDRYGKFIIELNSTSSWNGAYNGQSLPSTDYWFVVTRANGKIYKGHFTMKR